MADGNGCAGRLASLVKIMNWVLVSSVSSVSFFELFLLDSEFKIRQNGPSSYQEHDL